MLDGERAKAFAERWLPLWTGNWPEALCELYTEDLFYCDPAVPQGVSGKQAFLAYLRVLLAKYPDWVWSHRGSIPLQDGFLNRWQARLCVRGKWLESHGVCTVQLRAGRIYRNEVYFDRTLLIERGDRVHSASSAQD